jgi:hypothetical protein
VNQFFAEKVHRSITPPTTTIRAIGAYCTSAQSKRASHAAD